MNEYPGLITVWDVGTNETGDTTFGDPYTIKARWEDRQERFVDSKGQEVVSRARVFVAQDIAIDSYIMDGDHTNVTNPARESEAFRVRQFNRIPDLRHIKTERTAYV